MRIVFVCTGNTCRSPLAESIARSLSEQHDFASRGLAAYNGAPVSFYSAALIREHALPEPSAAEQFQPEDAHADLILTMSSSHQQHIKALYPEANVYMLSEFAAGETAGIADPYGGDRSAYQHAYNQIAEYVRQLLEKLDNTQ
ncbi:low molecular weight protein arginine phosphatase [Macrococcus equipercicus]|uniref:Low molecular weight protein-tyrosine-phosphatase PtpB n=1 Tax=Macrococcus equipercicus TaxID=69967 RepID=A0ABQ6R817_9STAP|nr:low molecular weight protein arginine phosphatase [Macrococcus equipercicus]KAA1039260.1 low molecular weight protein arginine phosphatase [Macrococcus equipercicus]